MRASRGSAGRVIAQQHEAEVVSAEPDHWRLPTLKPNMRSAMTASSTRPPASTAWTTESGAREMAATWRTQAPAPMPMPMANQG